MIEGMIPDPALLQTFVETVESGSFTAAARRVHRTQAAISMQIKRLEETVGCLLFDRSARRVKLTAQGELFYDHARRILRAYRDAMTAFEGREIEGEIAIGLPDDFAATYLPAILRRCLESFPHLRVHAVCEPSKRLLAQIADRTLDIAIVTEGEGQSTGIVLNREAPVWACSKKTNVHALSPVPVAIFHSGDVFRRHAIERLERLGRRGRITVTSPNFVGVRAAILSEMAVAVLFRRNVDPDWRILSEQDGFPLLPELSTLLVKGDRQDAFFIDHVIRFIMEAWQYA